MISQVAKKLDKTQTIGRQQLSKIQQVNKQEIGGARMYAIAFDMDIESLKLNYGDPYNNAYGEIAKILQRKGFTRQQGSVCIPKINTALLPSKILQRKGFTRQQGSVYFGDTNTINAVTCVLAAIDLSQNLPWFAASVKDIRMLRIEEFNDLMPAVQQNK